MNAVQDFARFKAEGRKISVVTAYDAWSARIIARSNVDAILVGDSAAMVMHGEPTTLGATVDLMALHTRAVARSAAESCRPRRPPADTGFARAPDRQTRPAASISKQATPFSW